MNGFNLGSAERMKYQYEGTDRFCGLWENLQVEISGHRWLVAYDNFDFNFWGNFKFILPITFVDNRTQ